MSVLRGGGRRLAETGHVRPLQVGEFFHDKLSCVCFLCVCVFAVTDFLWSEWITDLSQEKELHSRM